MIYMDFSNLATQGSSISMQGPGLTWKARKKHEEKGVQQDDAQDFKQVESQGSSISMQGPGL